MSTLSQFFSGSGALVQTKGSTLQIFSSTGSVTIPNTVSYVAYGAIGAGGGSCGGVPGRGGGGFSYADYKLTCGSSFVVCAVVGAGTCSCNGGASFVCGFSLGTMCAGGAQCMVGGVSCGGQINTCGGVGGTFSCLNSGGGGAGGLFGNGGAGGCASSTNGPGGGGGYGSGGGGGGVGGTYIGGAGTGGGIPGLSQNGRQCQGGDGIYGIGGQRVTGCFWNPTSCTPPQFTTCGYYSDAKTFFAAAGGGGADSQPGAPGGGGGIGCYGGFGGGSGGGYQTSCNALCQVGIGGGAGGAEVNRGGHGIVMVEYWR